MKRIHGIALAATVALLGAGALAQDQADDPLEAELSAESLQARLAKVDSEDTENFRYRSR